MRTSRTGETSEAEPLGPSSGQVHGKALDRLGFSLLEMVVVLLIVALGSAVVGVRLSGTLGQTTLRTTAKSVAAGLRYARSQATTTGAVQAATVDFEEQEVRFGALVKPSGEGRDGGLGEGSVGRNKVYALPKGVFVEKVVTGDREVASGLFEILFYPLGNSSGGEVVLVSEGRKRCSVLVDVILGTVTIEETDA